MDEADEYGIPYDYYSPEGSFRNYSEDLAPSFFDGSLEDKLGGGQHHGFGECMRRTLV
jgi:hypothetical protein